MSETTERTEYRVVVGRSGELPIDVYDFKMDLPTARRVAVEEAGQLPARIQTRIVTETPWVDLDEGEGK